MSKPSEQQGARPQRQVASSGRRGSAPLLHDGRIGGRSSRGRCRLRAARPRRTSRRPSASRPATRKPITSRTTIASTAIDGTTHMLMKRRDGSAGRARLQGIAAGLASGVLDRRTFLRRSGLAAGAGAALGLMPLGSVRKAQAGPKIVGAPTEIRKNICTHCSVGCTVIAEVQNGVWVGQEPAWDSPINRGSHCAKGARCANSCMATAA